MSKHEFKVGDKVAEIGGGWSGREVRPVEVTDVRRRKGEVVGVTAGQRNYSGDGRERNAGLRTHRIEPWTDEHAAKYREQKARRGLAGHLESAKDKLRDNPEAFTAEHCERIIAAIKGAP